MATTVNISREPKGFSLIPEGETVLLITKAEGAPRSNPELITVEFVNEDGQKLTSRYDLTIDGAYAAFRHLVTTGCGFDIGEIRLEEMVGKFVAVEIVHKEGTRPRKDGSAAVFANIKLVLGPGEPFGTASDDGVSEDWD